MNSSFARAVVAVIRVLGIVSVSNAQSVPATEQVTLWQNVRIFNGKSTSLSGVAHVLVRGNKIEQISTAAIEAPEE